ncbi:MAG: hypothetical protein H6712_08405 [Myxococcales bacterium]|nr:hypothetical protein [Myxococcales bacterium]MCB9713860.1 hypothetical protein [Myxococcales bacterium]
MTYEGLTVGQRTFVWMWRRISTMAVGFPDPFVADHVRTEGVRGYLAWAKSAFAMIEMLEKRWGPIEAQLILGLAALWSGCRWCGVGHLLSANLELFKREGELGPIDERQIPELQLMRDEEVLEVLRKQLSGPRWEQMRRIMDRQYLLHSGQATEESRDDELLQTANVIWSWVIECSITAMDTDPATIPPQTPIGKERKLLARYREARAAQDAKDAGSEG